MLRKARLSPIQVLSAGEVLGIPVPFSCLLRLRSYDAVEIQQVQTAQSYKSVDHPGKPCHASKQKRYHIQIKKTDESPVDRADDHKCQREIL